MQLMRSLGNGTNTSTDRHQTEFGSQIVMKKLKRKLWNKSKILKSLFFLSGLRSKS